MHNLKQINTVKVDIFMEEGAHNLIVDVNIVFHIPFLKSVSVNSFMGYESSHIIDKPY